ncbi:MAG TPA: SCO family protein [Gallionella sp.]|nr:SCO family protein [Gallionella sp.]
MTIQANANRVIQRVAAKLAIVTASVGMTLACGVAAAASDAEQHDMHNMHQMHDMHSMHDHSMHDHHAMPAQRGITARTVESYSIPDIKLVDMDRGEVSLHEALDGKLPVILNFIYTSCTAICPVTTATFQQVQQELGAGRDKVRMVTISIDPENDTPARLKEYAGRYNAGSQWKMLTGTVESSVAVQRAFGVYNGDKMNHKPVTFLRAEGADKPWVRLDGFASAADIVNELGKLTSK